MRILYITCSNVSGGANVALVNIVGEMMNKGHQTMVVTTNVDGPLLGILEKIGCPYRQIPLRISMYPRSKNPILYLPRLAWMIGHNMVAKRAIEKVIREFRPNLVHTNVGPIKIGYDICHKLHIPHVWHLREYMDLDFGIHFFPSRNAFQRRFLASDTTSIAITQGVFNYRECREGEDRVIYDGVFSKDISTCKTYAHKDNYILFAGRIEPAKGPLDLLKAFVEFHRQYPSIKLRMAGSYGRDSYASACLDFVKENNLQDCVEFLGNRSDVYDLMAHARMFIVPSRFEGFGFITAEAMVNGCPVVGRNTAGTKEQFDKGLEYTGQEIGFRFNTNRELLEAMSAVMETDCSDMCERARRTVLHFYTREKSVVEIEKLYHQVLTKKDS